jgi:hypothetical protein
VNSDIGTIASVARTAQAGLAGGTGIAPVRDDLVALPDLPSDTPGIGFDRVAAAASAMIEAGAVAVGLYGPSGSGRSTLLRAIWNALPADRFARISVDPVAIAATDSLYAHLRDRAMARLTARFLGIRSRVVVRSLLWISDHPWLYGLAALLALTALALVVDPSPSWQMVDDVYHAWRTAKTGEEVRAVRYIMEWYPVGLILQAAPWIAAGLPLMVRLAPLVLRLASSRIAVGKASASDPQTLCRDLAAMAASVRRTLVFFSADLDRCAAPRIAELVDAARRLSAAGCVVVIACDDRYIEAVLASIRRVAVEGVGRELLAEAIRLPVRIPAPDRASACALLFGERSATDGAGALPASAIAEETIGPFVEPLRLTPRFLMTFVHALKLQLAIDGAAGEVEVRRLAAAVLAEMLEPGWLEARVNGREPAKDSMLARHPELDEEIRRAIGGDEAELRHLRRRLGCRPRDAAVQAGTTPSDRC